jgi:DNA invertase Pin-like site-specific DNA recombinase
MFSGSRLGAAKVEIHAEHIATARRMKASGNTGKEIAKYLGVSRATLYRCLAVG